MPKRRKVTILPVLQENKHSYSLRWFVRYKRKLTSLPSARTFKNKAEIRKANLKAEAERLRSALIPPLVAKFGTEPSAQDVHDELKTDLYKEIARKHGIEGKELPREGLHLDFMLTFRLYNGEDLSEQVKYNYKSYIKRIDPELRSTPYDQLKGAFWSSIYTNLKSFPRESVKQTVDVILCINRFAVKKGLDLGEEYLSNTTPL